MKHWRHWGSRIMGGLAALALLTHCGGVETGRQAAQEVRPQTPDVLRQSLATTQIFEATADARVEAANPTWNFGGQNRLVADQSPWQLSYLRFNVGGVTGTVSRAVLRLYALDGTSDGPRVYASNGAWAEGSITWNNRPAMGGTVLGDVGAISSYTYVEYDLTGFIHGSGQYDIALSAVSGNGADFASREHSQTEMRPRLILTVEETPPPTDCMPRIASQRFSATLSDGYVSQSQPTARFGTASQLLVDASPYRYESFLRYSYVLPSGWFIREATLQLHATNGTSDGPRLYLTHPWQEYDFNWNTRPPLLEGPVADLGPISSNTWVELDVSPWVREDSFGHFALLPDSSDGVDFVSMDSSSASLRPRLSILRETDPFCTYQGAGGVTDWVRHYGGAGPERLQAMASDATGSFVSAGQFGAEPFPLSRGFALARYTPEGVPLWTRRITTGNARVEALAITPEGNILAVGSYDGETDLGTGPLPTPVNDFGQGLFIAKFSPSGQPVWAQGFLASYVREGELDYWPITPRGIATDAQGSLIVTGEFHGIMDLGGGPLFAGEPSVYQQFGSYPGGFLAKFAWNGDHLWSRAFLNTEYKPVAGHGVATDAAGNVLVSGAASSGTNLGDGPLGEFAPFIARYDAAGNLLWKRLFHGLNGQVVNVQPLVGNSLAFIGHFQGTFFFAGQSYTGGNPEYPQEPDETSSFFGTLSASQGDGWLRALDYPAEAWTLATSSEGTITVGGQGGEVDLGGGPVGYDGFSGAFVARYSWAGDHHWSRGGLRNFEPDLIYPYVSTLELALQPGGAVLLGGSFSEPVEWAETTYTSRGASDLLYLRLLP